MVLCRGVRRCLSWHLFPVTTGDHFMPCFSWFMFAHSPNHTTYWTFWMCVYGALGRLVVLGLLVSGDLGAPSYSAAIRPRRTTQRPHKGHVFNMCNPVFVGVNIDSRHNESLGLLHAMYGRSATGPASPVDLALQGARYRQGPDR